MILLVPTLRITRKKHQPFIIDYPNAEEMSCSSVQRSLRHGKPVPYIHIPIRRTII
jgi:hypothetical protein